MIFGVSTACFFLKNYTEDAINIIGDMGVKNIEVFFSAQSETNPKRIKEMKKRIQDKGISVYSVHAVSTQFEPQLFSAHDRQRMDAFDAYKQVLEAGEALGAGAYVFHGPTNIKIARKLNINYPYTAKRVSAVADLAKEYGIKLTYETVHWCWYAHPEFPTLLEPHLTTDNLYYTLDCKQVAQSFLPLEDYIRAMGHRLENVHLCDYRIDDKRGVVPVLPFKGQLDFEMLKTELGKVDYDKAIILEVYQDNYHDNQELKENFYCIKDFFEK